MNYLIKVFTILSVITIAGICRSNSYAQALLAKKVSITATKKPLPEVLNTISKQGNFYFSYNSNVVNNDSMVTLSVHNKTVQQVLDILFGDKCQYKETDNHIIIQSSENERWFQVTGYVTNSLTGQGLSEVSVFERQLLASTLTDASGHFKLNIKESKKYPTAQVTISKGTFFTDTTIVLLQGYDQEIHTQISPSNFSLQDVEIDQYAGMEKSWLGKFLFSSKLRKQSANLGKFFVNKPFQFSFVPGVGTHGKLTSQVANRFSFNVLGGYTAGTRGFELGGLFNIDKKDVKYVQIGGLFNLVSGKTEGLQIGGLINQVADSAKGVQISGISNLVRGSTKGLNIAGIANKTRGKATGMQLSGIANIVENMDTVRVRNTGRDSSISMRGMQLTGIANMVNGRSYGCQMAGIANINNGDLKGAQISSIYNHVTGRMDGLQIGLINVADTSTGYAVGIVNIIKNGYHTLAISSTESTNINIAFKGGTRRLYSILMVSANTAPGRQMFAYAYGIGKSYTFTKHVGLSAELLVQDFHPQSTKITPAVVRFELALDIRLAKKLYLTMGPSVSLCPFAKNTDNTFKTGLPTDVVNVSNPAFDMAAWFGWKVGLNIF